MLVPLLVGGRCTVLLPTRCSALADPMPRCGRPDAPEVRRGQPEHRARVRERLAVGVADGQRGRRAGGRRRGVPHPDPARLAAVVPGVPGIRERRPGPARRHLRHGRHGHRARARAHRRRLAAGVHAVLAAAARAVPARPGQPGGPQRLHRRPSCTARRGCSRWAWPAAPTSTSSRAWPEHRRAADAREPGHGRLLRRSPRALDPGRCDRRPGGAADPRGARFRDRGHRRRPAGTASVVDPDPRRPIRLHPGRAARGTAAAGGPQRAGHPPAAAGRRARRGGHHAGLGVAGGSEHGRPPDAGGGRGGRGPRPAGRRRERRGAGRCPAHARAGPGARRPAAGRHGVQGALAGDERPVHRGAVDGPSLGDLLRVGGPAARRPGPGRSRCRRDRRRSRVAFRRLHVHRVRADPPLRVRRSPRWRSGCCGCSTPARPCSTARRARCPTTMPAGRRSPGRPTSFSPMPPRRSAQPADLEPVRAAADALRARLRPYPARAEPTEVSPPA